MEQTPDQAVFGDEFVISVDSLPGLEHVHLNSGLSQPVDGFRRRLEHEFHAARQNHDVSATIQQFPDVGNLNAGDVVSLGLPPIPFSTATWPEFQIATDKAAVRLDPAPLNEPDSR